METIIEMLERRLQPAYVGWQDQYRAILYALGVREDTPAKEVLAALSLIKHD